MGSMLYIKCKNCDYSREFTIGIGMSYDPFWLMDFDAKPCMLRGLVRSKAVFEKIRELVREKGAELADRYGHWVWRCPSCGGLYERFLLRLEYRGGSYEAEYKCPSCRVSLEPLEREILEKYGFAESQINISKYPCPQCGKHSLYRDESQGMCWD